MRRVRALAWLEGLHPAVLVAALTAVQALLAFALPPNHDEDQYLAASVLVGQGARLYRDFLYVQTPLQPWATGFLAALAAGHVFLGMRLLSVALGAVTMGAVWGAQRTLGVARGAANVATALAAATYVFQFSFGVFRNDALPTALLALGLSSAAFALRPGARRAALGWAGCAGLMGLAASAKASFVLPLAGAGAFLAARWLLRRDRARFAALAAFGVGTLAGLAPIAVAWASDAEAVRYALVDYWRDAPRRWYAMNGMEARLDFGPKLLDAVGDLALGPALAALAVAAASRRRAPAELFLDVVTLAALAAALAPAPTYRQYFAPLLPPLFVRLGLARLGAPLGGARARMAAVALALFAIVGAGGAGWLLGRAALTGGWGPPQVADVDRRLGAAMHDAGVRGEVATLSPRFVLDSGLPLDRRFAGGAMIYRSADAIPAALRARLHLTSPASLAADLDARPPAAIVTGFEDGGGDVRVSLDAGLRAYARSRGYLHVQGAGAHAELYLRRRPLPR